jgi:hypothetical protein
LWCHKNFGIIINLSRFATVLTAVNKFLFVNFLTSDLLPLLDRKFRLVISSAQKLTNLVGLLLVSEVHALEVPVHNLLVNRAKVLFGCSLVSRNSSYEFVLVIG